MPPRLAFLIALAISTAPASAVDFVKDVRPIFEKHCYECHSVKAKKEKAGFVFDDVKRLANDVGEGRIIVPKKVDESDLIYIVAAATGKDAMPPDGERLSPAEVATLKAWITEGANLPGIDIAKKMAEAKAQRKTVRMPMNWTNKQGKVLRATFEGIEGEFVLLKAENGTVYKYPLSNLNPAGQVQAKLQAEE